ncbi:MAG TPA: calcium-binding protein [Planctomycetota bacterium]|nr:calcium-binding protein [Planctomycetota bacterium]
MSSHPRVSRPVALRKVLRGARALIGASTLVLGASAQVTTRVSVDSRGIEGNQSSSAYASGGSWGPALTIDGRWIAFESSATNLVGADVNALRDVFVHDRWNGVTERVSVSTAGVEGDGASSVPALSGDARFVAFESVAANLVAGDGNSRRDIFVRDRLLAVTERVSVSSLGAHANNDCFLPSLSSDGRFVVFTSVASNLVAGDVGGFRDVFLRDRQLGTTTMVSVSAAGAQGNGNSFDGRLSQGGGHVVFTSVASNLAPVDGNGTRDVLLRDLVLGTTELVSVSSGALQADFESDHGAISAYGRFVAFQSGATNLVAGDTNGARDVFVRDRVLATTTRVSVSSTGGQTNFWSYFPSISADGDRIVFDGNASNLVTGDTNVARDVFLHERSTATTTRISVASDGQQGTKAAALPSISADGTFVVFETASPALVPGDSNTIADVFVRSLGSSCAALAVYCTAKVNSSGCTPSIGTSGAPLLSGPDAFRVTATNVLDGKVGILLWGQASAATPFLGGTLCIAPPIKRFGSQLAAGAGLALPCGGTYSFAFDQAYAASQGLQAGQMLFAQIWSRDNGFSAPDNAGLTDALQLTICP